MVQRTARTLGVRGGAFHYYFLSKSRDVVDVRAYATLGHGHSDLRRTYAFGVSIESNMSTSRR